VRTPLTPLVWLRHWPMYIRVSSEQRQRWSRRRLRYLRVGRRRRRRNPSGSVDTTWKVPGRRWVPLCAHRLKTRSDDCCNYSPPIVDSCFAAPLLTKHSLVVYREAEKRNRISFMNKSFNMQCNLKKKTLIINEYYRRCSVFNFWNLS